jgi:hypothetical protein
MAAACIAGLAWHRGRSERGGLWTRPAVYGQHITAQSEERESRAKQSDQSRTGQDRTVASGEPRPEAELAGCRNGLK